MILYCQYESPISIQFTRHMHVGGQQNFSDTSHFIQCGNSEIVLYSYVQSGA